VKGIRRVVLAQDVASRDAQTIRAAVELAARLGAEVVGLFLEDLNLFRLVDLPVARQVNPWGRELNRQSLEGELRAMASKTQADLAAIAQRLGVQWSFQVLRGELEKELAALGLAEDLLVIGTAGRVMGLEVQVFSTLHKALRKAPRSMLLLAGKEAFHHPLVVLHEESANPEAVLDAALSLMQASQPLAVLMIGDQTKLATLVQAWQAERKVVTRPIHTQRITPEQLAHLKALSGCDGLVVGADFPLLQGHGLERLLFATRSPMLVVQ